MFGSKKKLIAHAPACCNDENIAGEASSGFQSVYAKLFLLICGAVVAYLPLIFLRSVPLRDVASRYAPMAEAFAQGDFLYAFHPRCQMLHTTVAGSIAYISGCDGFTACQYAGFLFFILSVFPLFFLARRIWGASHALMSVCLLLLFSPVVYELASSGLRDSCKMFVQLLMAHGMICIVQERDQLKHYLYTGIACGLAVCTRNELLLSAVTVCFAAGVLDNLSHRFPWRSFAGLFCMFGASLLELGANTYVCGYAIPSHRFYKLYQDLLGIEPALGKVLITTVIPAFLLYPVIVGVFTRFWRSRYGQQIFWSLTAAAGVCILGYACVLGAKAPDHIPGYLSSVRRGVSPVFFPLAALGSFVRLKKGLWRLEECFLAALFVFYVVTVLVQILIADHYLYVSHRYLLPAVPLLLPWSWSGVIFLWQELHSRIPFFRHKAILPLLLCSGVLLSLYFSYQGEINARIRKKDVAFYKAVREIAARISTVKPQLCKPEFSLMEYRSNRRPKVYWDFASKASVGVYLGGGSLSEKPRQIDFLVSDAALKSRQLKKKLRLAGQLRKCGNEIIWGKNRLQIWKVQ